MIARHISFHALARLALRFTYISHESPSQAHERPLSDGEVTALVLDLHVEIEPVRAPAIRRASRAVLELALANEPRAPQCIPKCLIVLRPEGI
jgi:hypothetical protein